MNNEQLEMSNGKKARGSSIYSLLPLDDFKALLGVDDREDKLARFCLTTATYTIEQYCMRRFLRKKHFERIEFFGDLILSLREYPVNSMIIEPEVREKLEMSNGERLGAEFYRVIPDCGSNLDFPYSIELSPAVKRWRDLKYLKVVYVAGYSKDKVPADLVSACMELAGWNFNRYKGRRIGMTGSVRGAGKDGEHFEMSMPENVRSLLEPYRRKTI